MNNQQKKEKFSIRKYSVGVGSILIGVGITLAVFSPEIEASVEVNAGKEEAVSSEVNAGKEEAVSSEV
ncbi:MSCRAMM family adhesin SdrC, partial [Staphylococcus agnetis]